MESPEMSAAMKWYFDHFKDSPDMAEFQLGIVTLERPTLRIWFVDKTVLCHAGTAYLPVVTDDGRTLDSPLTNINVQRGDYVAYSPTVGLKGIRAYRWIPAKRLLETYRKSIGSVNLVGEN